MGILYSAKDAVWRHVLVPFLCRRDWRRANMIPLGADYLLPTFGFDEEGTIKGAVSTVKDHTLASFERLATLWQQVRYLDRYNIPGGLVECGVWKGGCAGLMALAHMHNRSTPEREIHLFDSFQGLPQPDRNLDGDEAIGIAQGEAEGKDLAIGACVASIEESRHLLIDTIGYPRHLIKIHPGWYSEVIPEAAHLVGNIALLRLDCDWYKSTETCLKHLYSKVSDYGVVVIDDYGHFSGCRRAVDDFVQCLHEPVLLNHIDYTGRFWVKTCSFPPDGNGR
jgi:O-methyltransferase